MKKLSQRGDILHGMAIIIFNFQLRFFRNKAMLAKALSIIIHPVLALILVLKHRQIACIATFCYVMAFNGLADSTSRLMSMRAVGETAILGKLEYLAKITSYLLGFHVKRAKTLNAWSVYKPPPTWQRDHF